MSKIKDHRLVYNPLSGSIYIARFGVKKHLALDKRDCLSDLHQICEQICDACGKDNGGCGEIWSFTNLKTKKNYEIMFKEIKNEKDKNEQLTKHVTYAYCEGLWDGQKIKTEKEAIHLAMMTTKGRSNPVIIRSYFEKYSKGKR